MLGNDCLYFFTFQDLTYLINVLGVQWWLPPLEMGSFSLVAIRIEIPFTKWHRTPMEPSSGQKWNKNSSTQDMKPLWLQLMTTRLFVNNSKIFLFMSEYANKIFENPIWIMKNIVFVFTLSMSTLFRLLGSNSVIAMIKRFQQ